MSLDDRFGFGKYEDCTPRELLRKKKGLYLMWCLNNIHGFHIEPASVEDAIRLKYTAQYIKVREKQAQ